MRGRASVQFVKAIGTGPAFSSTRAQQTNTGVVTKGRVHLLLDAFSRFHAGMEAG